MIKNFKNHLSRYLIAMLIISGSITTIVNICKKVKLISLTDVDIFLIFIYGAFLIYLMIFFIGLNKMKSNAKDVLRICVLIENKNDDNFVYIKLLDEYGEWLGEIIYEQCKKEVIEEIKNDGYILLGRSRKHRDMNKIYSAFRYKAR